MPSELLGRTVPVRRPSNTITGVVRCQGEIRLGEMTLPLGKPGAIVAIDRRLCFRTYQTPQVFLALSCIENVLLSTRRRRGTGLFGAWLNRRSMWRGEHERWARAAAELNRVGLGDLAGGIGLNPHVWPAAVAGTGGRGLAADPVVLLLDEPAAGLNVSESAELVTLLRSVRDDGISLVLVEHRGLILLQRYALGSWFSSWVMSWLRVRPNTFGMIPVSLMRTWVVHRLRPRGYNQYA